MNAILTVLAISGVITILVLIFSKTARMVVSNASEDIKSTLRSEEALRQNILTKFKEAGKMLDKTYVENTALLFVNIEKSEARLKQIEASVSKTKESARKASSEEIRREFAASLVAQQKSLDTLKDNTRTLKANVEKIREQYELKSAQLIAKESAFLAESLSEIRIASVTLEIGDIVKEFKEKKVYNDAKAKAQDFVAETKGMDSLAPSVSEEEIEEVLKTL